MERKARINSSSLDLSKLPEKSRHKPRRRLSSLPRNPRKETCERRMTMRKVVDEGAAAMRVVVSIICRFLHPQ